MQELIGDLWDLHDQGFCIGIPTNGDCRRDGHAVMGAGLPSPPQPAFPNYPFCSERSFALLETIPSIGMSSGS